MEFDIISGKEITDVLDEIGSLTLNEIAMDPKYRGMFDMPITKTDNRTEEQKKEDFGNQLVRWKALRLMETLNNRLTPDSRFYDTGAFTMERHFLDERIEANPDKQFIVVWDFHY